MVTHKIIQLIVLYSCMYGSYSNNTEAENDLLPYDRLNNAAISKVEKDTAKSTVSGQEDFHLGEPYLVFRLLALQVSSTSTTI